ncbi:hypothetical protein [Streptomyces chartreusis]|uniref:hypothetical protein n=1 Tax=Streptomyces chartreusis TaxID=1969 RepID=UPI0021018CAD|nr:hypothetical protein [Streptomyces chartreusis]
MLADQLYELHIAAGKDQEYLERWPGDTDLLGVLDFAQEYARALKGDSFQKAAVLRMQLAQWLRLAADPFQLAAIDDARTGPQPLTWETIALSLGYLSRSGNPNPGSAKNLRDRLYVAVNGEPGDRRQPQVAHLIDRREAERRRAELRFIEAGEARYAEVDAVARALLDRYEAGEVLADPEDDGFWWEELAGAVVDRQGPADRARLAVYVRAVVRQTYAFSKRTNQEPASTDMSRELLERAAAISGLGATPARE